MRQLRPHRGQPDLAVSDLVASGAAELLKALHPLTLRRRALVRGDLRDDRHRFEGRDAPLEPLRPLLALLGEAKLAVLPGGVAILAAVSIEKVRGQLLRTLPRRDHLVERGVR